MITLALLLALAGPAQPFTICRMSYADGSVYGCAGSYATQDDAVAAFTADGSALVYSPDYASLIVGPGWSVAFYDWARAQ